MDMQTNRLKHNVRIPPSEALTFTLWVVGSVYHKYGHECVVTSCMEGSHSRNSLHYAGLALDFRIRHLPPGVPEAIAADVRDSLTDEFDVVLERTHLHVEYQPERGINM